jgi:hypothetical protein
LTKIYLRACARFKRTQTPRNSQSIGYVAKWHGTWQPVVCVERIAAREVISYDVASTPSVQDTLTFAVVMGSYGFNARNP